MKINKKFFKLFLMSFLTVMFLLVLSHNVLAAGLTDKVNPNETATGSFKNAMEIIIGLFQVVAIGMAAIMLIVLAIKYMSSSSNEKAEIKKHAVVYLVGACIAFGAAGILQIFRVFTKEALD